MHEIPVEEIQIPVSWGTISGKWWGPKHIRPILCFHGWEDNAGSFDLLIPQLPRHLGYLAIDFPGHGFSSKYPNGKNYNSIEFVPVIRMIQKFYNWDKISLMGHSMGSNTSVLYSGFFPNDVDLMIAIDGVITTVYEPKEFIEATRKEVEYFLIADERNEKNLEPPSYSYNEIIEKMSQNVYKSITEDVAKVLLKRGMKRSEKDPDKFYFSRDGRLRLHNNVKINLETYEEIYRNIKSPIIYLKAVNQFGPPRKTKEALEVLKTLSNFQHFEIEGRHHVHMTNPERISVFISDFINKYREEELEASSKL